MKDISFLAFEVKLSLLRQSLTDEGGIFRKPKPDNIFESLLPLSQMW